MGGCALYGGSVGAGGERELRLEFTKLLNSTGKTFAGNMTHQFFRIDAQVKAGMCVCTCACVRVRAYGEEGRGWERGLACECALFLTVSLGLHVTRRLASYLTKLTTLQQQFSVDVKYRSQL